MSFRQLDGSGTTSGRGLLYHSRKRLGDATTSVMRPSNPLTSERAHTAPQAGSGIHLSALGFSSSSFLGQIIINSNCSRLNCALRSGAPPPQQLEEKLRDHDKAVLTERPAVNPPEDGDTDCRAQRRDTELDVVRLWRLGSTLDRLEEEGRERLKRVLVHVINVPELDKQKVYPARFLRDLAVLVTGLVDENLGLLRLLDLGVNLGRLFSWSSRDHR